MTPPVIEPLSTADIPAVLKLVDEAAESDGVTPLSDQAALSLHDTAGGLRHVVARTAPSDVAGYLQLHDDEGVTTAELVVSPRSRHRGVAMAMATWALATIEPGARVTAWAHGNSAAAAALAAALGFTPHRVLLQMRRSPSLPLPEVRLPTGIRMRTFEPGDDDEAWVRSNARAFAGHPEQGRLTVEDLHERMSEPWFDAAGFFVAERLEPKRPHPETSGPRRSGPGKAGPEHLAGFHWTKVHEHPAPVGEVYAVGVDPDEQGNGLGLALTVTGLAHLVAVGVPTLMLYADESNSGAVRMYERLGFTVSSTDVTYEWTAPARPATS